MADGRLTLQVFGGVGDPPAPAAGFLTLWNDGTEFKVIDENGTITTLEGPQGPAGADGSTILTGSGAPAGGLGVVGDLYIDTDNNDYYVKTGASTWTLVGNLTGATGPAGPAGPPGTISVEDVADITDPTEIEALTLLGTGSRMIARQVIGSNGADITTIYQYDADGPAKNAPFVMNTGDGGNSRWIAQASRYSNQNLDLNGTLTVDGNIATTGTVDGRDVAADGTKLDGIEAGATADQTAGEIKSLYESNANTNAFTDAEQSKLSGIQAGAEVNPDVVPQAEAEAGTATTERIWTAERVAQAIAALASPGLNPQTRFRLYEDWVTGNTDQDEMGTYGWRQTATGTGNNLQRLSAVSGHPGILRMEGGTAAAARVVVYAGESGFNTIFPGGGQIVCEFVARITGNPANFQRALAGLCVPIDTNNPILNGIFMGIRTGDTNWHLTCVSSGTETRRDTGIAFVSGNWVRFRWVLNAAGNSVQAFINGTTAGAPVTTNIPNIALSPCLKTDALSAGGGTATPFDIDYLLIEQTLTR